MDEIKVLVTGSNGFIGANLVRSFSNMDGYRLVCPTHQEMDITNFEQVSRVIHGCKPNVVVNLAAHRNANTAEIQKGNKLGSVWMTNVIGPQNIAEVSRELGVRLIHISTDMVFDGYSDNKGPYLETDLPKHDGERLSWYGLTKALGEQAVLPTSTIIRIGNVSQPIYHPNLDYIGKLLWRFDSGKKTLIFPDQTVTLTEMTDLTKSILKIINGDIHGVFHVASPDTVSPFKLTEYLLKLARPSKKYSIDQGSIDDYLKLYPNRYPKYGGLDSKSTQERLGVKYMTWKEIVNNFVQKAL